MLLLTCDAPAASQDADGAQELYERMLQLHPHDAGALCDYGSFLYEVSILTKPEGKGCRLWDSSPTAYTLYLEGPDGRLLDRTVPQGVGCRV